MTAPASGVVLSLTAQPGAQVMAGAPLASIGNAGAIQASIGLPPEQAIRVRRGDLATVTVLGASAVISGRVSRVSGQLDPQTRLAPIMIALPANAATLGTAIEAQVAVGASHPIVWVPQAAVAANGAEPAVFVVEKGIAHRRTVRLGQEDGDRVAVLVRRPGRRCRGCDRRRNAR